MARYGFGVLVASEDGKVVSGILSERDIVRKIAEVGAKPVSNIKTRSIMTRHVHTCTGDDTVEDLMRLHDRGHRFRHVPVVDADEQVCGMISMSGPGQAPRRRARGRDRATPDADHLELNHGGLTSNGPPASLVNRGAPESG